MSGIYIYGASFLEALAIYACQRRSEKLWLTLGPREVIVKQIVESIQPGITIQMLPPQRLPLLGFEEGGAYILSGPQRIFEGLFPAILNRPACLLVLFCDELPDLERSLQQAGISTRVWRSASDLREEIEGCPPPPLPVYLTSPQAAKTAGDLHLKEGLPGGSSVRENSSERVSQ